MFTGIVESKSQVVEIARADESCVLKIASPWPIEDLKIGASVAINGCCLTITEFAAGSLCFDAGAETLSRTNLGALDSGSQVNLERAMAANGRFDGHIVSGHIDCTGELVRRSDSEDWSDFWFKIPDDYQTHLVPKGSVTVDGVSLTVVKVEGSQFSVALIPHTLQQTILGEFKTGRLVNIETDILAKYIQKQIQFMK